MLDLTFISDFLWSVFDGLSAILTVLFCLALLGVAFYALASVVYNLVLMHRRKAAERWEPPTAKVIGKVYPNGEGDGK